MGVELREIWGMVHEVDCMVAIEEYSWMTIIYFCVQIAVIYGEGFVGKEEVEDGLQRR